MEISQHDTMAIPQYLGVTQDETMAVEISPKPVQHMSKS